MSDNEIAIVGMSVHLPGAQDVREFWDRLRLGEESIRQLTEEELLGAGVRPETLRRPGYVRAAAILDDVFGFDAEFFGFSPKEAAIMDPQHRHFLMTAWEAFEDAGHPPGSFDGAVGVFAGCGMNSYFVNNLLTNPDLVRDVGLFLLRHTGNDKDFLSTRVSYLFDLHGPSVNVQTACSTSLVATHMAVQHLLSGECDMALAGGVTIEIPHGQGYQYEEGEILSPDGHCRSFDHRSQGTVFGSGSGAIVLRRLDDAIAEGDHVYAVIKGSAVNNDGGRKVGYLAPSVDGQAACVTEALGVAEVDPASVGFVECHGTATPMGDPIEVAALKQAFQVGGDRTEPCRIGSVKSNIGHLDTAAGVAGLVKATLALSHAEIPPSLHFEEPNPALELESSPFVVNNRPVEWKRPDAGARRAGVNSLGVGGTNAFVVLEEAPDVASRPMQEGWRVLTITGRNRAALDDNTARLARYLREHPDVSLSDVAWTLQVGRRHFAERRVIAARTAIEAADLLDAMDQRRVFDVSAHGAGRPVVFMFPGGGVHHLGMAAGLRATEPAFAATLDEGLRLAREVHGLDLERFLTGSGRTDDMDLMAHQLPLIFLVEYAMTALLRSWGIEPTALVGHSLGENTAACVAGTFEFADALGLVVLRGRLMDEIDGGAVTVPLAAEELAPLVAELGLDLAVENQPDLCLVSGATATLAELTARLATQGVETIPLTVTTPVHSRLLEPVLDRFEEYLRSIELRPPSIAWVSNRTGTWITTDQAVDPKYWVEHLRRTVRFSDCIATLAADPSHVLLEVGPGRNLSSLARSHPARKVAQSVFPTMRHPDDNIDDAAFVRSTLGRLAAAGVDVDIDVLAGPAPHRRVPLPAYAFQKQQYNIEPGTVADTSQQTLYPTRTDDQDQWFWRSVWLHRDRDPAPAGPLSWLVLLDDESIGTEVARRLRGRGDDVVTVRCGDSFQILAEDSYVIAPELGSITYESLVRELMRVGRLPDRIAHVALLTTDDQRFRPGSSFFHRNLELGFQSLVLLAQAWSSAGVQRPVHISVATMGAHVALDGDRAQWPEQATVLGPVRVIPREFEGVTASTFDLAPFAEGRNGSWRRALERGRRRVAGVEQPSEDDDPIDRIVDELLAPPANEVVALRGPWRLVHDVRRVAIADSGEPRLRRDAVVVITGGLGGIGLTVAEALFDAVGARFALMTRSALPSRDTWVELVERLGPDHPTSVRIRRVQDLEARGAQVLVVVGDVTDVEQATAAIDQVRSHFGRIDGVVHAAGTIDDSLIVGKSVVEMNDVLAPKVYGTQVLEDATRQDDLDLFVVFSSTSTVAAPIGQVDYVAANEFVNAFAAARRAEGARHVLAIDWGVWNEVGMTAELTSKLDPRHEEPAPARAAAGAWFDERATDRRGTVRLSSRWTATGDWFLDDHRTGTGDAVLPGSAYLELARAALAEVGLHRPFEIAELTFLRPLAPGADGTLRAETTLEPTAEGYSMVVRELVSTTGVTAEGGPSDTVEGRRRCAEATLLLHPLEPVKPLDLDAVRRRCPTPGPRSSAQQTHLRFGPRWQVVQAVHESATGAIADLRLPDAFADDLNDVGLHPALVDLGTGFAMSLVEGYSGDRLWAPLSYRTVRVHGRLGQEVVAVASARPGSTEQRGFATFDVALCDPDGTVVVEVLGFTIKRTDGPLDVAPGRAIAPADLEADRRSTSREPSAVEAALRHNVASGITPQEGRDAFARLLRAGAPPVVYVSPIGLPALREQTDLIAAAQLRPSSDTSAVFDRPTLASDYVAPRNPVEEQLVGIWQELLGVSTIGVDDDFFELGGHSLIAVRLFARVKRQFSVDFPISILFDAPTVARCAELIMQAVPAASGAADEDGTVSAVVVPQPQFRHVVPMHPGDGGPRSPFFLVAGMFGNVLNLRDLAHQIGTDRPFYGLQARGLYGGEAPHADFVEMAADYLAEMRVVQPHGPYLLGGFSGGGITALEMARLLIEQGEDVGLLVMLDTPTPTNPELSFTEKARLHGAQLRRDGLGYIGDWARSRIAWERAKRNPPEEADAGSMNSASIGHAFNRAVARYEMRHYPGTITLYRPRLSPLLVFSPDRQIDQGRRFIYSDNGWGQWSDGVDVTEVPGSHDGMVLEPNVRVLAGHIRSRIDDVERQRAALGWATQG